MDARVRNELTGMIDARRLKAEVEWLTERSVALARREDYDWGASADY